jgi:hypothetical protein
MCVAGQINPGIRKDEAKAKHVAEASPHDHRMSIVSSSVPLVSQVVDTLKVADLPAKAVFCRCWKSEKVKK